MRRVVDRLPLPEHVIALGELQLAAGRAGPPRGARSRSSAPQRRLLAGAGVDTDAELAVFEAGHGSPRRAVALARRGVGRGARDPQPPTRSAGRSRAPAAPREGLAWARRRCALGSLDPLLRFHAGMARPRRRAAPPPAARARPRARGAPVAGRRRPPSARVGGAAMRRARPARGAGRRPRAAGGGGRAPARQLLASTTRRASRSPTDRVDVTYLLDQAEIPTFQERDRPRCGGARRASAPRSCAGSRSTPAGGGSPLRARRRRASRSRAGQGGLPTTRVELALSAAGRDDRADAATARPHLRGPRGLEGDRRRPRPRHGRARERPVRGPDGAPDPLPARPARRPGRPARGDVRRARRCGTAHRARRAGTGPAGAPGGERRLRRACSATARPGCRCCCWPPPSAGAPCTRSRPGTARRWSPPTWSARAARRGTRSRSG